MTPGSLASRVVGLWMVAVAGCEGDSGPAPGSTMESMEPQLLFVVRNDVYGIRLDGTARRSFGTAGDDRKRAGYARLLPDGRLSALADQVGLVFPEVSDRDYKFHPVAGVDSVLIGDGLCGATLDGQPQLVWFQSSLYVGDYLTSTGMRASTDGQSAEAFGGVRDAGLFGPSPDGPDHVLAVHSPLDGDDQIWRIDLHDGGLDHPDVLADIPFPAVALSPNRLSDGRIVYVQFDLRDPDHIGEIWVVERDGTRHGTDIRGVDDLITVGNQVVYEAGGGDRIADLLVTDLNGPAVNITNTPYDAEHLGWGPHDIFSDQ